MNRNRLLVGLLLITLIGFVGGLLLPQLQATRPSAPLHLVFAIGIMPLIFGAMTYFVPVLTRTGVVGTDALLPALLGLLAGLLVSYSLLADFTLYPYAAIIGLLATGWLGYWIRQRKRSMLGRPHPGLLWYELALLALFLGLLAILAGHFLPQQWPQLRRFHLHINTLGFIGFTALGTLRVLLPTSGRYADPGTGPWLVHGWRWLALGTLLIATGAAWLPPLALLGLLPWLWPVGRFIHTLLFTFHRSVWQWHGATTPLATATLGLMLLALSGAGHGLGWLPGDDTTRAFIPLFLLPLVSGAATHLLPLWLAPQQPDREQRLRKLLGRHATLRAALFFVGGLMLLAGQPGGLLLILPALLHFLVAVAIVLFPRT
ncbi:MAG: hypothetical protein OQL28_12950 [Sedimenticola sp.]|nr:hypothetical protein [Sedimenticola sp.]